MTKQREKTEEEITDILERTARGEITYPSAMLRPRWGYSQLVIELERRGLGGVRNVRAKGTPAAPEAKHTPPV